MIRSLFGTLSVVILLLVLVLALLLLTSAAQHADISGEFYSTLLLVNVLGIVLLAGLVTVNVWHLYRQFRAQALGSRLTMRLLGMFVLLAGIPLAVVYYFSVQFLSKGVDSWFDVRVEQAIGDALLLGRTTLEVLKQDVVDDVSEGAASVTETPSSLEIIRLLDELRERGGYSEVSLFTLTGRIDAFSSQDPQSLVPDTPDESVLTRVQKREAYASLEPISENAQQLRIVVPVLPTEVGKPVRALQALKPLPLRYANLSERIESASTQYKQMVFSRGPLKFSLILTLTLVTLAALLLSVWAAIYISRLVSAPLRDLAEGTGAVARGNYNKELPVTSSDEFGVLVKSFNEMTQRINEAQNTARRSQREAEEQRTYLETVLAHLSSGVLSFDTDLNLLTQNTTASQIFGITFAESDDRSVGAIKKEYPRFESLFAVIEDSMNKGLDEWQHPVTLFGARGRQILIVRGTKLPGKRGGYVVVFDDVTDLIQAQRDAAWGEVARRLAHEIKNPLTPIQLSVERIRQKYSKKLSAEDYETLDRATRTIAQQVESMKNMVNAFSNYAQPVQMKLKPVRLNRLVQDVAELHRRANSPIKLIFDLDEDLPELMADSDRLRQVLNNLLINAKDALVQTLRPEIRISTLSVRERDGTHIRLTIADNGPGVPKDIMERLFEPYVSTKDKGTGLGLAIVKRIVEEHGGALWVENRGDGGACVTIQLPQVMRRDNVTDPNLRVNRGARAEEKIA